MRKLELALKEVSICDICGSECFSNYVELKLQNGLVYHGCSEFDPKSGIQCRDALESLYADGNLPEQQLQEVPDAEAIVAEFKKAGMAIEPGASYSVRGQIAQLIEGVRGIFQHPLSMGGDK